MQCAHWKGKIAFLVAYVPVGVVTSMYKHKRVGVKHTLYYVFSTVLTLGKVKSSF